MKPPRRLSSAERPGKPTPVRALRDVSEPVSEVAAAPSETSIVVDGASWRVTVDGAALGGGPLGPASLLMLCFTRDAETDVREAWVVGDGLDDVSEDRLVRAFRVAKPRPERREPSAFFEGLGGRRGR